MSSLAPALEKYFTVHLLKNLGASAHTVAAYRDTWRLLLAYTHEQSGTEPHKLDIASLDSAHIGRFLQHLEQTRHNSVRTRNARLAAIHSFYTYAASQYPEHAATISQVLTIPMKRTDYTDITYLSEEECQALLAAPDQNTRTGRRDHALLLTAITTGLRVAELTALTWSDIHLGTGAYLNCHGKGRKDRATPLNKQTRRSLRQWHKEQRPNPSDPIFPTSRGTRMSADAVAQRVAVSAKAAAVHCQSLREKHITAHVLRHTTAMRMLHAGIDTAVIALWLGHESPETTQIYLHADMRMKEAALERIRPTNTSPGRYKPGDQLLAFLQSL